MYPTHFDLGYQHPLSRGTVHSCSHGRSESSPTNCCGRDARAGVKDQHVSDLIHTVPPVDRSTHFAPIEHVNVVHWLILV